MVLGEDGVPITRELTLRDSRGVMQFHVERIDGSPVFGTEGERVLSSRELYKIPEGGELKTYLNESDEGHEFVWETSGFQLRNRSFDLDTDKLVEYLRFEHNASFTIPKGFIRAKITPYLSIGDFVTFLPTFGGEPRKVAVFINDGQACACSNIISDEVEGEDFTFTMNKHFLQIVSKMSDGPFNITVQNNQPMEITFEDSGYRYIIAIAPAVTPRTEDEN